MGFSLEIELQMGIANRKSTEKTFGLKIAFHRNILISIALVFQTGDACIYKPLGDRFASEAGIDVKPAVGVAEIGQAQRFAQFEFGGAEVSANLHAFFGRRPIDSQIGTQASEIGAQPSFEIHLPARTDHLSL